MIRRQPNFLSLTLSLTFSATVGLFALSSLLLAQQPPTPDNKPPELKKTQEENRKVYTRLMNEMLKLALRWEKSDNLEDQGRAKTLRSALKIAEEKGVDNLFKQLLEGIENKNPDFNGIFGKDEKLIAALEEILKTLETEDEYERIKREIANLKELIKEVERIKREQENLRARTENPKSDNDRIAKEQNNLTKQTQDVSNKIAGKDPKGKPNDKAKDDKAESKPETKPGDSAPEAKPDTGEKKSDPKATAEGPMNEPKTGEPKPSPGGMEAGSSKDSPKDGPMSGDPKSGDTKPMGGNPMDPKDPKPGEAKPMTGESKAQGEGKGDMKPSEGQPGEGKPMASGQTPPSGGQPSASKPSGGQPSGGPPPSGGQPKQSDQAQENIQQAIPQQQGAEQDLKKNDRPNASSKEDKAIEHLEEAIKELEKRLKQLREKELAKLLGNLEERVNRMLRMQMEVYEATKSIDKAVKKNNNMKTTADIQKAQTEADREMAIIAEAEKALKLMEGEGSAVVFAGVLNQVKGDMEAVQKRLTEARVEGRNKADQAEGTQLIEEDIIEQLTMMKEALKKAKQDLENQQNKPPGESNGKPNQKLLDLLNELKLIRSLQEQVNKRTISYSKQDAGEQAKDPLIQGELKQLSDRQRVLQEMLHKIATEANQ